LKWKETLAILSTYGKSDEFPAMCEKLGSRLESEMGDYESATLCFMCAVNIPRTVSFWTDELKASRDSKGKINTISLQNYIEKVVVFTQANPGTPQPSDSVPYFIEYANLLASQGRFDTALSYLKSGNQVESALVDRLYHASTSVKTAGTKAPVFPFEKVNVTQVASSSGAISVTTTGTTTAAAAKPSVTSTGARATPVTATPAAKGSVATPAAQTLAPGWAATVDPSTGRTYYYNFSTNQSQWDAPLVASTPAPVAAQPAQAQPHSQFQQQQQPQSQAPYQAVQSQSQQPVQRHTPSAAVHPSQAGLQQRQQQQAQAPSFSPVGQQPVSYPVQQQQQHPSQYASSPMSSSNVVPVSATPKPAPIPEPVKPKELLPDSEAILLLEQVIAAVTGK
jgi:protein transport protein SEC31